jgi:hypothetical protein
MKARQIGRWALLALVVLSLGALALQKLGGTPAPPAEGERPTLAQAATGTVQAYYFHTNFRCMTCNSIEEQARRAILEDFAAQVEAGTVAWTPVNIDKAEHAHFAEAFELTSASLVLSDGRGPEGRWKLLDKTWALVRDPAAFREYVHAETAAFLAAAR